LKTWRLLGVNCRDTEKNQQASTRQAFDRHIELFLGTVFW